MCHCDGLDVSSIIPGQNATFISHAKVLGTDTKAAYVRDTSFGIFAGNVPLVTPTFVPDVQVTGVPGENDYQATWTVQIPALSAGITYQVNAVPNCARQVAMNTSPSRIVLDAQTTPNLFQQIISFFAGLFGVSHNFSGVIAPTPIPHHAMQLQTFPYGQIIQNACTYLYFKLGETGNDR